MLKSFIWDFVGRLGGLIVSFGVSILLTRILSPAEFGIMGLSIAVIGIASVFIGMGYQKALVQKQEITPVQYNTVFLINTAIAVALTLICFFLATPLARFYHQPLIEPVFRVLSLTFLINGLNIVPSAILYKQMNFKMITIISLVASVISGVVGVIMAYQGFGVWSLVAQTLLFAFTTLLINWGYVNWWPGKHINFTEVKSLWTYGSRLFASGFLDMVYTRADAFIIGRIFSTATLGYYTRAQTLDNFVKQFSTSSFISVLFPLIARNQFDRQAVTSLYHRYLHIISFISVGLSAVLFLIAKDLFIVLFTSKWNYAAELFQLMALAGFAYPVSALMVNIISGVGNSRAFLRLEIYKRILITPVYVFGFLFGLKWFIIIFISVSYIVVILNAWFASKELITGLKAHLLILLNYIAVGIISVIIVLLIQGVSGITGPITSLLLSAFLFALFYLGISKLIRLEGINTAKLAVIDFRKIINDKRNKNLPSSL